jgi:hypothetical protein
MKKATYKQRLTRWLCKGRRKYITTGYLGAGIFEGVCYSVNNQRVYAYTLSMMEIEVSRA